jgi:hypothetical protein
VSPVIWIYRRPENKLLNTICEKFEKLAHQAEQQKAVVVNNKPGP